MMDYKKKSAIRFGCMRMCRFVLFVGIVLGYTEIK